MRPNVEQVPARVPPQADQDTQQEPYGNFVSHLDLSRAPYVLYGVKYIDLVSLGTFDRRYFQDTQQEPYGAVVPQYS